MATVAGTAVEVISGDLTAQPVDAIVNAANEHLQHGGGVAAAIVRAGGRSIQVESDTWVHQHGPLRPGVAAVTSAGDMPARWVVHVAGPRYRSEQDNEDLLRRAVRAALDAAAEVGARTVALPAISAGIFGYPPAEASQVIASEVVAWCHAHSEKLSDVLLVGYGSDAVKLFEDGLATALARPD